MKDRKEIIEEWHAFWYGWGEGVTRIKEDVPVPKYVINEPHWYKFGQGIGALTWPVVLAIIVGLFFLFTGRF